MACASVLAGEPTDETEQPSCLNPDQKAVSPQNPLQALLGGTCTASFLEPCQPHKQAHHRDD